MFEWNVEEMALINNNDTISVNGRIIYPFESALTKEDKINFIDSMTGGKLSYLLSVINRFEADRDSLCKDNYGYIKTVSLKAWLKKNDVNHIIDDWYHYGKINFLGCERYIMDDVLSHKGIWDYYDCLVDEVFNRQLKLCAEKERAYFKATDTYEVLKKRLYDYYRTYNTTFGVRLGYCSNGSVYVHGDDDISSRDITIEEAQTLIDAYEKLGDEINKITHNINIKY